MGYGNADDAPEEVFQSPVTKLWVMPPGASFYHKATVVPVDRVSHLDSSMNHWRSNVSAHALKVVHVGRGIGRYGGYKL
jgi:hypothetical protein